MWRPVAGNSFLIAARMVLECLMMAVKTEEKYRRVLEGSTSVKRESALRRSMAAIVMSLETPRGKL